MLLIQWINQQKPGVITRLHHATGLSYTAIQKAVRGTTRPRHETARRIAAATGGKVTVDEVYSPPHTTPVTNAAAAAPTEAPAPRAKPPAPAPAPAPAKNAKRAARSSAASSPRKAAAKPAKPAKRPARSR